MNLARQIEAARVAREREGNRLRAQMEVLRACDLALITEGRLDLSIAMILNGAEVAVRETVPLLRRIAQHAIDAHCTARAAARIPSEVSVYDRGDLEKYLAPDRPISDLRILVDRLLPSEALTLLLSLLPPENA